MSSLSDRLRAVIGAPAAGAAAAPRQEAPHPAAGVERALGGEWRDLEGGACFVVERRYEGAAIYGRDTVGAFTQRLAAASDEAPLMTAGAPAQPPFVFFDLETTGLSGGAGTHAFLVGCGWCEADGGFTTRQFMLTRFADERLLLAAVAAELSRAGAIVSFNGKSFDAPVLETRYLFHRLHWPGGRLPHLDVLHPARCFWRRAAPAALPERVDQHEDEESGCSLGTLERQVLGARRAGDVPGFEIPGRYFQFIRSGDARPLAAVLEHNRLDLLSLAGLTARLLQLVRCGPDAAGTAREMLALGRVYARAGLDARARDAFARAVAAAGGGPIRIEALRALALAWRRIRQYDEAASCWRTLLDAAACPSHVAREATEALAVHHEHRVRDFSAARAFALRSLGTGARAEARLRHRLARIERKIEQHATTLKFQL